MKHKASDSNLDFNGMAGTGVGPSSRSGVCANPYSIGSKALSQNVGSGPRTGNTGSSSVPNVTARSGKISGGTAVKCPANPSKINAGSGPRKGNA